MNHIRFTPPPLNSRERLKQLLLWLGLACGILLLGLLCFYHLDYSALSD